MRHFELVEGTSSKFWEIDLDGASFTVRFGRIGTAGQSQTKSFDTDVKARAEHDKLVREKTAKGYVETGASSATGSPALAPKPAPAAKPKPAAASTPPAISPAESPLPVADAPVSRSAVTAQALVATDPRTWPAAYQAELHPRREWPRAPLNIDRKSVWERMRKRVEASAPEIAKARLSSATPPDAPADEVTEAAVAVAVCVRMEGTHRSWNAASLDLCVDHWAITGGVAFAMKMLLSVDTWHARWTRLAEHLARADEAAYVSARATAEDLARTHPLVAGLRYLFPETGAADAAVMNPRATPAGRAPDSPMDVAAMTHVATLEHFAKHSSPWMLNAGGYYSNIGADATVFTFVARFGESALPALVTMFDKQASADINRSIARGIGLISTPNAFVALLKRSSQKTASAALREFATLSPHIALPAIAAAATERGEVGNVARTLLALIVQTAGDLTTTIATLPAAQRTLVEQIVARGGSREIAEPGEAPAALVSPPWLAKKKSADATAVTDLPDVPYDSHTIWPAGLKARWSAYKVNPYLERWVEQGLVQRQFGIENSDLAAIGRGDETVIARMTEHVRQSRYSSIRGDFLLAFDFTVACNMLLALAAQRWWSVDEPLRKFAADHELAALAPLVAFASAQPADGLPVLQPFDAPEIAIVAAHSLRAKRSQNHARAWLLAHPAAAAAGLVPIAVGAFGARRDVAGEALRFLANNGHEDTVVQRAARYRNAVATEVRATLDFDPLQLFPARIPKLPDFIQPGALPPVVLTNGKVLSESAVTHFLTMLAISRPEATYAGVAHVKNACTPESLAAFSWELFNTWLIAGAPSKESWAFAQMGFIGNDECARKLAALVRVWPGESAHARAVTGLDVLATIGTDVALMHLHGISQKLKFKGLQEKAGEKITQIADARGLTAEELADRLVPDLGLGDDGAMDLDFGPRKFRVSFDESLKPFVKDEQGARLADLPKPRKDDDPEKSAAAVDRWKSLKKDAKTIASQQVSRLERAMCARRRWTTAVFRQFIVEHPIVRHLAYRLAWATYAPDGTLQSLFRVIDDGTFADPNDETWELPDGASVGVAHALEMPAGEAAKLAQVFGDYEILQPFRQLGRETYVLTDEEKNAPVLKRWNAKVPTGRVLGMETRGWRRGAPQDGGVSGWMERTVTLADGTELTLSIQLDPGIIAGMATEWDQQTITGPGIGDGWGWNRAEQKHTFGDLDAVTASEIIRDLEQLVNTGTA